MKRVNNEMFNRLEGNPLGSLRKQKQNGQKVVTVSLAAVMALSMTLPAHARTNNHNHSHNYCRGQNQGFVDYSCTDIIDYNQNWGTRYESRSVNVSVNRNNVGVVNIDDAPNVLSRVIYDHLGRKTVENSRHRNITFDVVPGRTGNEFWIDSTTFDIYRDRLSDLGRLNTRRVTLRSKVFESPDGQIWAEESEYIKYIEQMRVLFVTSDGIFVTSYQAFKDRENQLAQAQNNNQNNNVNLRDIEHVVHSDGTIWMNRTIMREYNSWLEDSNYNFDSQTGTFYGHYGNFIDFEHYARFFNNEYFIEKGLRRSQRHYGANEFLYATEEEAKASLEKTNGRQYRR